MNTTTSTIYLLPNSNVNVEGSTATDIPIFYYIIVLGSLMLCCLIMIMIFYWYHHNNLVKLIRTSSPSSRRVIVVDTDMTERDRVIKLGYLSSNGSSITSPKSMESSLHSSPPPLPPTKTHQHIIPIPTPARSPNHKNDITESIDPRSPNKKGIHLTTNSGTPWEIFAMNNHSLPNLHAQPPPATAALSPHQHHPRQSSLVGPAAYYNNNNNHNHNPYGTMPISVTSPNGTMMSIAPSIPMPMNATAIPYGTFAPQQQQQTVHVMRYSHNNNLSAPVTMSNNNNNNNNRNNIGYGAGQKPRHKSSDVTIKSGIHDVATTDARTALTEVTTSSSEESVEEEENYDSVSTRMAIKKKKKKKYNHKKYRKYKEENEDKEEEEEEDIEDGKQTETVIEIDVDLEDEEEDEEENETENVDGNTFKQKEFVDPEAAPTMLSDITSSDDEEDF